jgi:hypothetical protein
MSLKFCGKPKGYPALQRIRDYEEISTRTRTGKVGYVAVSPETLWGNEEKK